MSIRVGNQQLVRYAQHTSVTGDKWQYIKQGITTGAGSASSLVDTNGDSGSANTYNGRYWVRVTSGACKWQWAQITDDDGAGTLTLGDAALTAAVGSGESYEIWLSPDPVVVVDSSSGATDMVDSVRAEADDYFNGYYAFPLTGNRAGEMAQVTDFVSATGTFTLGSGLSGALAAGDVVILRRLIEVGDLAANLAEGYHDRIQQRVNNAIGDGVVGARSGDVGFSTHIYASGSLSASGSKAGRSVLAGLFQATGMVEVLDTSSTTSGASSTTSAIDVAAGSWENHTIGGAVMINGEMRAVASSTDGTPDVLNITPALPSAPADSVAVNAMAMYRKSLDSDTYGILIDVEQDGVRTIMTGCKGSFVINAGAPPTFAWSLQVDHWIEQLRTESALVGSAYTTNQAILETDRRVWLDSTQADLMGFTCSPNAEVVAIGVQGSSGINGRSGFQHNDLSKAGGSYRRLLDSSGTTQPQLEKWWKRTAHDLLVVMGTGANQIGIRMPVSRIVEYPGKDNQDGLLGRPSVVRAQDAGTATDGGSTTRKIPDFAIFLS